MKKIATLILLFTVSLMGVKNVYSHCEVPCGIYDDELRIALLYEHITTIEKAMEQIGTLSGEGDKNYNQIVRWIVTKEEHAVKIQDIANQYFITQRIKLPEQTEGDEYEKYIKQLTLMHQVIVYAMKAKQTTDMQYIEKMRKAVGDFEEVYFEGKHRHNPDGSHK